MFDRDDKTNGNNSKLSAWYYNNNLRAVFSSSWVGQRALHIFNAGILNRIKRPWRRWAGFFHGTIIKKRNRIWIRLNTNHAVIKFEWFYTHKCKPRAYQLESGKFIHSNLSIRNLSRQRKFAGLVPMEGEKKKTLRYTTKLELSNKDRTWTAGHVHTHRKIARKKICKVI